MGQGGVSAALVLSLLLMGLGVAAIVRTLQFGIGGGFGLLFGAMLITAGAARLYLARRSS